MRHLIGVMRRHFQKNLKVNFPKVYFVKVCVFRKCIHQIPILVQYILDNLHLVVCCVSCLCCFHPSAGRPLGPKEFVSTRKFAMKFFGLAMTPPLSPPFWKLHCVFFSKIYRFETNKICNVIFWIGNDPPHPPFGTFPKKHPFLSRESSLRWLGKGQVV